MRKKWLKSRPKKWLFMTDCMMNLFITTLSQQAERSINRWKTATFSHFHSIKVWIWLVLQQKIVFFPLWISKNISDQVLLELPRNEYISRMSRESFTSVFDWASHGLKLSPPSRKLKGPGGISAHNVHLATLWTGWKVTENVLILRQNAPLDPWKILLLLWLDFSLSSQRHSTSVVRKESSYRVFHNILSVLKS